MRLVLEEVSLLARHANICSLQYTRDETQFTAV